MSATDDVKARAVIEAERRWDGRPSGRVMRTGFLDTFVAGAEWAANLLVDPDALARAKAKALREVCTATWEPRSEFYAGLHHCVLPPAHGGPHVEVVHGWRWHDEIDPTEGTRG